MINRRQLLAIGGALTAGALVPPAQAIDEGSPILNPCNSLPRTLREHEMTRIAFEGLDASQLWDCHAHLLGLGETGGGAWVSPKMQSIWQLRQYVQYRFYLNASCVNPSRNVDLDYLARLLVLLDDFPTGCKAMVMAFDHTHNERGVAAPEQSAFHLPNRYAADLAARHPARLAWTASIHPYRRDVTEAVNEAVARGAVAVKWLPPAMGIDPASPRCDSFYRAMVKHDLPLITHGGEERAVQGAHKPAFGNVLRLRRPLEQGVRVVVAHCASLGSDIDLDRGEQGPEVECFALFERLMAADEYRDRLFGDISALPQTNRFAYLERILKHRDWEGRLLNGSDYPLPGVFPLFSVDGIAGRGWLTPEVASHLKEVRQGNPLLFDFLLKRHLRIDGRSFGRDVFETARVFRRKQ